MITGKTITWSAPEYEQRKKETNWYVALGITTTSVALASFLLGNMLFAVLVLLGAFTLTMYSVRKPGILNIVLNNQGMLLDNKFYPYNTLESFWVEEYDKEPKIILQSEKTLMPYIVIPLGDADPDEVREFLFEYLEEEEHYESFSHKIMDYLGF
ncbi:MAG TPA: hypothetical protein ENI66_01000 [Candidatus Yonathbacteria bacterium]|nr:hypothetical protein [Candidatus Yonathbacteria bacterium]